MSAEPVTVHTEVQVPPSSPAGSPEWERWRGRVEGQLETMPKQITEGLAAVGRQIGQMETNLNGQLIETNRQLRSVDEQTKRTNGRVNGHDVELAELKTRDATLDEAEEQHRQDDERKRYTRRDLVAGMLSAAAAAGALFGGLAAFGVHL